MFSPLHLYRAIEDYGFDEIRFVFMFLIVASSSGLDSWSTLFYKRRSAEAQKRRSAEAQKRRSAEAQKRRSAEAQKRRKIPFQTDKLGVLSLCLAQTHQKNQSATMLSALLRFCASAFIKEGYPITKAIPSTHKHKLKNDTNLNKAVTDQFSKTLEDETDPNTTSKRHVPANPARLLP